MKINEVNNKKILISPLNWGLGHVSRCIGLVQKLQSQQNIIFIACDAPQQKIFESYLSDIEYILHDGYPFEFSGEGNFATDLFLNRKKLLPRFAKEQKQVQEYIDLHAIEIVIADQRYGFFSKKIPSIFVTHQLHLPLKWYQFVAGWFNKKLMSNFSDIWCLDDDKQSLAGKLSQPIVQANLEYIGWFSRFSSNAISTDLYDKLFVVSGPEPYAEQFFQEITDYSLRSKERLVCLIPTDYPLQKDIPENLKVIVTSDWRVHDEIFHQGKTIVSRAGYSTMMDLKILDKKAILIPTVGQSEQIYLSQLHSENPNWRFIGSLKMLV